MTTGRIVTARIAPCATVEDSRAPWQSSKPVPVTYLARLGQAPLLIGCWAGMIPLLFAPPPCRRFVWW